MTGLILVLAAFVLIIIETHVPSFGIFGIMALVSLLAGGKILVDQGQVFGIPVDWEIFIAIATAMTILLVVMTKIAMKSLKPRYSWPRRHDRQGCRNRRLVR